MKLIDIVIIIVLAVPVWLAIRYIRKKKKSGGCCSDCSGCESKCNIKQ